MTFKSFIIRFVLYLVPVCLLGFSVLRVGQAIGETLLPQQIIAMQTQDTTILYNPDWQRQDLFHYKVANMITRQPDVLILGSSRMYNFRASLFHLQDDEFYNGAIAHTQPTEIQQIVETLVSHHAMPKILIISLDLPYYNRDAVLIWNEIDLVDSVYPPSLSGTIDYLHEGLKRSLNLFFNKPDLYWSYVDVQSETPRLLGLHALRTGSGFRNDGSNYLPNIEAARDDTITARYRDYEQRVGSFESGEAIREGYIQSLQAVLEVAQGTNTTVIGIFPPFQKAIFDQMTADGDHSYLQSAKDQLIELFESHNTPIYDFTEPTTVGGDDSELWDHWHPGERLALRMYIHILQNQPTLLSPYSDIDYLEGILANAENAYNVYEDFP